MSPKHLLSLCIQNPFSSFWLKSFSTKTETWRCGIWNVRGGHNWKVTPETRRKPTASHFFKELLEHCATRAWHLLLLGNLCSPMSRAMMEATMEPSNETGHTQSARLNRIQIRMAPFMGRVSPKIRVLWANPAGCSLSGAIDLRGHRTCSLNDMLQTAPCRPEDLRCHDKRRFSCCNAA